jgi:hypothetical protein
MPLHLTSDTRVTTQYYINREQAGNAEPFKQYLNKVASFLASPLPRHEFCYVPTVYAGVDLR